MFGKSMYHRKDVVFKKPSIYLSGIEEYACRVSSPPCVDSEKVAVETVEKCPQWADIASSTVQVKFLSMLVGLKKARRVLEIGTFTGHATLEIAASLPQGGTITTIDSFVADENARDIALSAFLSSRHRDKIQLVEMDALSALDQVGQGYDLIFIDADKPNYKAYYEKIVAGGILAPDGVLVMDNTLWGGRVLQLATGPRDLGQGVSPDQWVDNMLDDWSNYVTELNDHVVRDPRVENVLLPVHDGMTLIWYA
jgi:caffeoyl-CoA O-methyltransferase